MRSGQRGVLACPAPATRPTRTRTFEDATAMTRLTGGWGATFSQCSTGRCGADVASLRCRLLRAKRPCSRAARRYAAHFAARRAAQDLRVRGFAAAARHVSKQVPPTTVVCCALASSVAVHASLLHTAPRGARFGRAIHWRACVRVCVRAGSWPALICGRTQRILGFDW
jgi:hypothetical protein